MYLFLYCVLVGAYECDDDYRIFVNGTVSLTLGNVEDSSSSHSLCNWSGDMLEGYSPVVQSLQGTFFTWGLTAAGAALVFVLQGGKVFIKACLGIVLSYCLTCKRTNVAFWMEVWDLLLG